MDISGAADLLGRNKKRHCIRGEIVFGVPGIADDENNLRRERLGSRLMEAGFVFKNVFQVLKKNQHINFEVDYQF